MEMPNTQRRAVATGEKRRFPVGAFVMGILVAVVVFHAYTVYQMRALVIQTTNQASQNAADIQKIGNFLNAATGGAAQGDQQVAPAQAPAPVQQDNQGDNEGN